jgi:hypothetical protein
MHSRRLLTLGLIAIVATWSLSGCGDKGADTVPAAPPGAEGSVPFGKLDFASLEGDFPAAIKTIRASQAWSSRSKHWKSGATAATEPTERLKLKMSREDLEASYELGQDFLINWQLEGGNFRYMYDWFTGDWVEDDHQVRQAGSLWGIATCYRYRPTEKARKALDLGIRFWFKNTVDGPSEGTLNLRYPGDHRTDSGTIALVSLALVEYLKTDAPMDAEWRTEIEAKLDGYLAMLQWMQLDSGHISKRYDHRKKRKHPGASPYYDGESLLAMTKAARQLGKSHLVPTIERAARAMAETYTVSSWKKDIDSKNTKGFFQWGCMSFVEYYLAQWKDYELFGDVALSLGWWMDKTHRTLSRRRNHAYAIEGVLSAWRIAHLRNDHEAETDLLFTMDRSLYKLSSWQIGGPLAKNNRYLQKHGKDDPMSKGGVMNAERRAKRPKPVRQDVAHQLRIDVTQHQMHAVTMSLEEVYPPLPTKN